MVREWKPMSISKRARVLQSATTDIYFLAEVFIEAANDLKTNRIKLPCESTYVFDVNKYPPKPLPKARRGGRTRIGSRTRQRRTRISVASAVNTATINLHAHTMKSGLIGTTPMACYSETSSHMLSIRTGTALTRLDNFYKFTSKTSSNPG